MGWETFTGQVIKIVDRYGGANLPDKSGGPTGVGRGIVFIAWGAHAASIVDGLDKVGKMLFYSSLFPDG
jgi:uracil-DNA glycosylase